jgi:hypothetical protein
MEEENLIFDSTNDAVDGSPTMLCDSEQLCSVLSNVSGIVSLTNSVDIVSYFESSIVRINNYEKPVSLPAANGLKNNIIEAAIHMHNYIHYTKDVPLFSEEYLRAYQKEQQRSGADKIYYKNIIINENLILKPVNYVRTLCNVLSLDDGDGLSDASVQNIRTILDLIN